MIRRIVRVALTLFLVIQVTACSNKAQLVQETQEIQLYVWALETPEQMSILFGDGNTLLLDDRTVIATVMDTLKSMQFKQINQPAGVGQYFVIQFPDQEAQYASTGELRVDNVLYTSLEQKAAADLSDYIVEYGRKDIPDLLGESDSG